MRKVQVLSEEARIIKVKFDPEFQDLKEDGLLKCLRKLLALGIRIKAKQVTPLFLMCPDILISFGELLKEEFLEIAPDINIVLSNLGV